MRSRRCCAGRSATRTCGSCSGARAAREWVDGDGVPTGPSGDRVLTAVERDGRPAVAIVHDEQLAEDPELVHAAGAVALLAHENAELELAWTDSLRQLRESRARIAAAGEVERRALERDLHDGAQQQLTAVLMKLALVGELLPQGSAAQLGLAGAECRARGDPAGAAPARPRHLPRPTGRDRHRRRAEGRRDPLRRCGRRSPATASDATRRRWSPPSTTAASRRCRTRPSTPGRGPASRSRSTRPARELRFEVRDDGPGFDPAAAHGGVGLRNMHDRLDALHGRLEISSAPGRGSVIAGAVPVPLSPWSSPRQPRSSACTAAAPTIGPDGGVSVGG